MSNQAQEGTDMANAVSLPETGFLRLNQIVGNPNSDRSTAPIIPVSQSTWWDGVRTGRFPQPIKLGPKITAWKIEDIRRLIDSYSELGER